MGEDGNKNKNLKISLVLIGVFLFTPLVSSIAPGAINYGAGAGWNWITGFDTTTDRPIGKDVASKWRFQTHSWGAGAALDVDNAYLLVNGVEVPEPSKESGYIESEYPVRTGDKIALQIVESGYYTMIHEYTVPMLDDFDGGQVYYQFGQILMYKNAHATAPVLSASYLGADIDANNLDISVNTDYPGITITIDLTSASFNNLAFGGEDYTEIVGDMDEYGKFIKFDTNTSAVIIKDIQLGYAGQFHSLGSPVWNTFTVGSDYQAIYKFSDMLVQDGKVSGDGKYELSFTFNAAAANNTIAITMYDVCDVELAQLGSPSATVTETVTITTE